MTGEYVLRKGGKIDESRCRAIVWRSHWDSGQCSRPATIDGKWCKQHDPAAVLRARVGDRDEEASRG